MSVESLESGQSLIGKKVVATLLYFDLFKHPLSEQEIYDFSDMEFDSNSLKKALQDLEKNKIIYNHQGYYSIYAESEPTERRLDANKRATQRMKVALKNSKSIASIPYVRGCFLSGTIAKGVMYEDSDIDFFVITAPGRLWMTKLFMKMFKVIFLGNSRQDFCYNYLISEDHLKIQDQNLYTATELMTLIPTYNYELYEAFLNENKWSKHHLPNFPKRDQSKIVTTKPRRTKAWIESLFNNSLGNWIDKRYMETIQKKYTKKFSKDLNKKERDIALRSTRGASKVHPNHYQKRFLDRYADHIKAFEEKYKFELK